MAGDGLGEEPWAPVKDRLFTGSDVAELLTRFYNRPDDEARDVVERWGANEVELESPRSALERAEEAAGRGMSALTVEVPPLALLAIAQELRTLREAVESRGDRIASQISNAVVASGEAPK